MPLPALLDVEEFFADPEFSGASISPDGTKLAYLAPNYGRTQVWVRGLEDEHEDAICVTHDKRRGVKTYYWTDDPRWLLYRQDTDGNEDWHIYRVDLENPTQPAVDLTPLPPGGRAAGGLMRSKPGKLLVGMNQRPMFFDLFEIDIATGETTLVREQSGMVDGYLGPDDGVQFYQKQAEDGTYEFYAHDEETGDKRLIYSAGGAEFPVGLYPVIPTPDGSALLLGAYPEGSDDLSLIRVDRATGEQTVVASKPGSSICTGGMFTEDFGTPPSLFFSQRTGELIGVRFVGDRPVVEALEPHFAEVLAELSKLSDGELESVSSDDEERLWVASFISDTEPGVTWLYDHSSRESRLLYRPELPGELAPMRAVSLTARDGLPLHGFLTLPVGVEPSGLPMVLLVHGGPWAHDVWGYNREVQCLANRGYAVLQINFRGSDGYGKRHITAAIGQLAGTMHDDLIDACDWAVKEGYADPSRIGIFGGSYGGYATLVGVTFTPDYFAAAVDYVGISSLMNFMNSLPAFVRGPALKNNWLRYAGDPDIPEQAADMEARSPINKVDEIRTPLLVVQGAKDVRVVQAESDAIVEALRARGVPVEYFVAEDEGHDFKIPENLVRMYRLIEKHFGTYLGGRVSSEQTR
jgi:dipeptidyl aminopeptidase/acylaminoacyl peptidase